MKKHIHILAVSLILASIFFSQGFAQVTQTKKKTATQKPTITLEGKLVQKPWAKSGQSYCAQGSDYYVLVLSDESEKVLEKQDKKDWANLLTEKTGKTVKIKGYDEIKVIKHPKAENGMELQHPITTNPITGEETDSYTCNVFVVIRIE
jgi:hypothetical protein